MKGGIIHDHYLPGFSMGIRQVSSQISRSSAITGSFDSKWSYQLPKALGCNHIHSKRVVVLTSRHETVVLFHSSQNRSLLGCHEELHLHKQSFHLPSYPTAL
jgi:hypothetical protein